MELKSLVNIFTQMISRFLTVIVPYFNQVRK